MNIKRLKIKYMQTDFKEQQGNEANTLLPTVGAYYMYMGIKVKCLEVYGNLALTCKIINEKNGKSTTVYAFQLSNCG